MRAPSARSADSAPRDHHVAVRALVARPGADRGADLVQLRQEPVGVPVAVDAVVHGRPRLGLAAATSCRRRSSTRSSWRADDADRHAARGRHGDRSAAVAGPHVARCEQPDAAPARHPRDRRRRVAVPRLHAGLHERAPRVHDTAARPRHVHDVVRRDHRRGRLLSIGTQFEEAARDLGATRIQALRMVLLPQLGPAIFASLMVVFATSVDDFVISSFLSTGASSGDRADQDLLVGPCGGDTQRQRARDRDARHHPARRGPRVAGDAAVPQGRRRRRRQPHQHEHLTTALITDQRRR